jgi:hypothetical protein
VSLPARRRKLSPLEAARALAFPSAQIVADEDPPPKKPPRYCPWCGGPVKKRWTPHKIRSIYQRPSAFVAHVCLECKVAVRAFKFPAEPLFESRTAARAQAQSNHDALAASGFDFAYQREAYQRGQCSCDRYRRSGWGPMGAMIVTPCPVHAPLVAKRTPRAAARRRAS